MGIRVGSTSFVVVLVVLGLAVPLVAHADIYRVSACAESVGYQNHSWEPYNSDPAVIEINASAGAECDQTPVEGSSARLANLAVADSMNTEDAPVGAEAGWRFTAPSGTRIVEVVGLDNMFKDDNNHWEVSFKEADDATLDGQTCVVRLEDGSFCEVYGMFQGAGLDTISLAIGIRCIENSSDNCPDGATIHDVRAELDEAVVAINDPIAPTNVVGTQIPVVPQQGTISILGSATDSAAGLLSLSVVNSSGQVVGGPVAPQSPCNYSFVTPCPARVEGLSIPIDTAKMPNGENLIRVEATNAAGDEAFSTPYVLTVENESQLSENPDVGAGSGLGASGNAGSDTGSPGAVPGQSATGSSGVTDSLPTSSTRPVRTVLDLKGTKLERNELEVHGGLSGVTKGLVTVSVKAFVGRRQRWAHRLTVAVKDGHFAALLGMPKALGRHRVTVQASYLGSAGYTSASSSVSVRSPVGRERPVPGPLKQVNPVFVSADIWPCLALMVGAGFEPA